MKQCGTISNLNKVNAYILRNKWISFLLAEESQKERKRARKKLPGVTYDVSGSILSDDEVRQIHHCFYLKSARSHSFQIWEYKMEPFPTQNSSCRTFSRGMRLLGAASYPDRGMFSSRNPWKGFAYQNPTVYCKNNSNSSMPGSRALLHGRGLKAHWCLWCRFRSFLCHPQKAIVPLWALRLFSPHGGLGHTNLFYRR